MFMIIVIIVIILILIVILLYFLCTSTKQCSSPKKERKDKGQETTRLTKEISTYVILTHVCKYRRTRNYILS